MSRELSSELDQLAPPGAPAVLWGRLFLWLPACLILGGVVAWAAVAAAGYFAPAVLFPLLTGVVVGALIVAMARVGQVGNRPTILAGLTLAIAAAVVGQHYVGYRAELERSREDSKTFLRASTLFPELTRGRQPVPPSSFREYMRWQAARGRSLNLGGLVARGPIAWTTWAVDALLLAVAAVAMVISALGQPYCSRCRSWYRTIRSGRLPSDAAMGLARLAGVEIQPQPDWARYRLIQCNSGCGPTGLLLFWEDSRGDPGSGKVWLSLPARDRVTQFLDRVRSNEPGSQRVDPETEE
ncbi:MAG: hypothetical protein GXY83_10445 [Rhodopirellula sp.]|nr:hypothetical protein [Rhodopirellula sp.]